jgi:taurine dioxygenase
VYEHTWCNGDIVIWDNIALQHARGSLKSAGRRVLQRVIVGTEGVCPQVAING